MTTQHLFYQTRNSRPQIERAAGVYLWDKAGKRYLDGSSGAMVSNIGHSNPNVLAAMKAQMDRATFAYRLHFESEIVEEFAAKLAALSPAPLNKVFFVSGGSEAVETAIKLARQAALARGDSKRWKVISRMPSYHGSTLGTVALTGYEPFSKPFLPMMQDMPKVRAPLAYLDGMDPSDPATGVYYANLFEQKIVEEGPESVLGIIVEPIGGASTGALVPPVGYMERLRVICDKYGVFLIYDEVMTGGGRTGAYFATEHWPVTPDFIILAKGIGGGYMPLGAVISRDDLVDAVLDSGGFLHGFTNAAMPLAAAAGLAVTKEVERQGLCARAKDTGDILIERLRQLQNKFEFIGDVRGKGMLLAFELMADRQTKAPLPADINAHKELVEEAYARGLIIYSRRTRAGIEGDHFMVCPPLTINVQEVDELVDALTASLSGFADKFAGQLA